MALSTRKEELKLAKQWQRKAEACSVQMTGSVKRNYLISNFCHKLMTFYYLLILSCFETDVAM